MVRLAAGETVDFSEPPDVGHSYEPFVRQQLRAIASALGIPYELLSGDVSQVTFASGRHALLEYRRQLESIQHHLMVFQLCRPVWLAWTRFAVAAGVLPEGDYPDVRWIVPLQSHAGRQFLYKSCTGRKRHGNSLKIMVNFWCG